jgi:hypothetical protein
MVYDHEGEPGNEQHLDPILDHFTSMARRKGKDSKEDGFQGKQEAAQCESGMKRSPRGVQGIAFDDFGEKYGTHHSVHEHENQVAEILHHDYFYITF